MKIKPYKNNAKQHPEKQIEAIAKSINQFGFRQAIVLTSDGTIIVGHGRYLAATENLGWTKLKETAFAKKGEKTIPYVIVDDLSEDEIKAYRLADNKLNESDWDLELAYEELDSIADEALKEITGFDAAIEPDDLDRDDKNNSFSMTITFESESDLKAFSEEVYDILSGYEHTTSLKGGEF